MHKDDCFYIGYFSKTIGTKGDLGLKLDVDNTADYLGLNYILIEINKRDQVLVPFFVAGISEVNKEIWRISLKNETTSLESKKLIGKAVFLPLSELPKLKGNQFYFHEVIGFSISDDKHGALGKIVEIHEYPAQNVIRIINEKDIEILVPIIDDTIVNVDRKNKSILIRTPDGLIDLYLNQ